MSDMRNPGGLSDGDGSQFGSDIMLLSDTNLEDDKEAIGYVEEFFSMSSKQKAYLQRRWFRNIEFLAGNQWLSFDRNGNRWIQAQKPGHRVRYKGNLMSVYVMTRSAKLLKQKPFIQVSPATSEIEDWKIARTSQKILRYLWQELDIHGQELPNAVLDLLVFGNSFIKTWYDPDAGHEIEFGQEEVAEADPKLLERAFGKKKAKEILAGKEGAVVNMGEAQLEAVSPFAIYTDVSAKTLKECSVILDVRRKSLDHIRWTYPDGRKVSAEASFTSRDFYEGRAHEYFGKGNNEGFASSNTYGVPSALVKELWVRPNPQYPDGYHLVVANNVVLHRGVLPKWCRGDLPYVHVTDVKIPSRFWGRATFDDLVPMQKLRNRAISRIEESANLMGNPVVLNPIPCRVNAQKFQNRPGEIIPYQPANGARPEYLPMPGLPNSVMSLPDLYQRDVMTVSGLNEPSFRGSAPTNVRTSSGLAQLIQQDESRLTVIARKMERALAKVGGHLLRIVAYEYEEERLAKVTGDSTRFEVVRFRGKDLLGRHIKEPGANYFDVRITIEPGFRSKQAQDEFLMNFAGIGGIDLKNPRERRWLMRLLDVGSPDDDMFGSIRSVEVQAHYENRVLSQSSDEEIEALKEERRIGPHTHDDHATHVDVHREFQRSTEYLELPEDVRLRIDMHVREHEEVIQIQERKLMEAQMAQMQSMAGQQAQDQGSGNGGARLSSRVGKGPMSRPGVGEMIGAEQ